MVRPVTAQGEIPQALARRQRASVQAAVDCPLCPDVTPERGVEILASLSAMDLARIGKVAATTYHRTDALVKDRAWREVALGWINGYWTEHRHGPSWSTFLATDGVWPQQMPKHVRRIAMAKLYRRGYLDGTKTPFGLKVSDNPRPRLPHQRRTQPTKARNTSAVTVNRAVARSESA